MRVECSRMKPQWRQPIGMTGKPCPVGMGSLGSTYCSKTLVRKSAHLVPPQDGQMSDAFRSRATVRALRSCDIQSLHYSYLVYSNKLILRHLSLQHDCVGKLSCIIWLKTKHL